MNVQEVFGLVCVLAVIALVCFGVYCFCDWTSASGQLQQAVVMDKVYTPEHTYMVPQTVHIGDTTYTYFTSQTDPAKWQLGVMVGENARWCHVSHAIFDESKVDDLVVIKEWTGGWSKKIVPRWTQ